MRKYIVEFIGTFFLVSGAAFAGAYGATLALIVMIYASGHISGAHFNPAVSVAMYMRKKLPKDEFGGYLIAQFLGAIVAGLIAFYVFEKEGNASCDGDTVQIGKAVLAELLGTFALAYVVLNVATAKGTAGNSFYGLAIGGTVLAMALIFGGYSGGVFNPAVGVGLALQESICWKDIWIYFVAPVAGGVLAALTFSYLNEADDEDPESIPEEPTIRIEDNSQRSV